MFTLMKNGAKAIALYNHYQVINDISVSGLFYSEEGRDAKIFTQVRVKKYLEKKAT